MALEMEQALKAASDAEKKKAQQQHQATMTAAGREGERSRGLPRKARPPPWKAFRLATSGFDKIQDGTRVALLNNQSSSKAIPGTSANAARIQ